MFETLRTWLNGTREYYTGVAIFNSFSHNKQLKEIFSSAKSDYKRGRLFDEIKSHYDLLKLNSSNIVESKLSTQEKVIFFTKKESIDSNISNECIIESEIYKQARAAARKVYKQCMNLRAQLFLLASVEDWQDQNSPDIVAKRSKMAVDVVLLYNEASHLFEISDYVKIHGRLPIETASDDSNIYEHTPDYLIQQELSNARKALSKLKNKPVNDARILLIAKHQKNIKILENKWHSLSSVTK